jgi:hypothetical protein
LASPLACDARASIDLFPRQQPVTSEPSTGHPNGVATGSASETPSVVAGSAGAGADTSAPDASADTSGPDASADTSAPDAGAFDVLPLHRYRFDGTGVVAVDETGGADGVIVGGATLDGSGSVVLDGNDDYVDLPNGIVSVLDDATFSAWLTWNGNNCWHRVFSFGSTVQGEDIAGDRETELFVTPVNCPTPGAALGFTALFELASAAPSESAQLLSGVSFGQGVQRHVVLAFTSSGQVRLYLDGERVAATTTSLRLSDINDVNNWLGRSQWVQDFNLPGVFVSFEIYDLALSDSEVRALFESGPR